MLTQKANKKDIFKTASKSSFVTRRWACLAVWFSLPFATGRPAAGLLSAFLAEEGTTGDTTEDVWGAGAETSSVDTDDMMSVWPDRRPTWLDAPRGCAGTRPI